MQVLIVAVLAAAVCSPVHATTITGVSDTGAVVRVAKTFSFTGTGITAGTVDTGRQTLTNKTLWHAHQPPAFPSCCFYCSLHQATLRSGLTVQTVTLSQRTKVVSWSLHQTSQSLQPSWR